MTLRDRTSHLPPTFEPLEPRLLLSANLPGLHLVDPTVDHFDGQVVYLDFDGAEDVTYDGPVTVENIDVPAFAAPGDLAGQKQEIITQVLDRLNDTFADGGLTFTTVRPDGDFGYSTVYVGGDGTQFGEYGDIVGISEKIDVGNQDSTDAAFFFSGVFTSGYANAAAFAAELAGGIAHETGHLLGYAHDEIGSDENVLSGLATTFKSPEGQSRTHYVTADEDVSHTFIVDGIFGPSEACVFEWYSSYSGSSGFLGSGSSWSGNGYYDPTKSRTFSSPGTYWMRCEIWDRTWTGGYGDWREAHRWQVTVVTPDTQGPYAPPNLEMEEGNGYYSRTDNPTFDWSQPSDRGGGTVVEYRYDVDDSGPDRGTTLSSYLSSYPDNLSNGSHTFYVQARDDSGNWGDVASLNFYVDDENPDAPSIDLTSGSDSGHSNSDNITNDSTPTFYFSGMDDSYSGIDRLYYRVDGGSWSYVNEPGSTEYVTLGSQSNGNHTIYAYTTDEAGNSSSTRSLGFTIDTAKPSTPWIDLRSSSDSGYSNSDNITNDSTPTVDFGSSSDTYRLYYDVGDTGPDYGYDSGSSGSWTTWGLSNGTSHVYVQAVDNAGNWSNVGSLGIVVDTVAPGVPTLRSPSDGDAITDTTPTLEWNAASDGTSGVHNYQLTYETAAPFDEVTIDVSGTSKTLSLSEDHWYWRVRATDRAGNQSGESDEWDFTIVTNRSPSKPGNPTASNVTATSARVSWGASTDPDGNPITYTIQWKGDWAPTWLGAEARTTADTYYDVTDLDPERVYDVRVKASDGSLDSAWNDQENVITTLAENYPPSKPGNPTASNVTATSARVSWGASTDPDGNPITYTIQWKGDWTITWLGAETRTTADTYYDVTDLDPERVYDVRVKASDGSLDSAWNDQENVITTVRPTDGKFMAITPWQFVKGEPLPVVLAYKDYPDAYLPNINYATVEIGPKDGPQKAVDLYSATGSNLGAGGHSIEFGDGGSDYYEICNDADWWYTVGYIRPEDYNDSQYWPGGSLRTEVTMTWKPWALSFEETATATSAVQLINDWPSWEGWYAGDTHFHSALTDTLVLDSVYSMEYGSPLGIARLLGESMELDWLSLTDHSYDLDDDQEPFLELWTPNDPDVYMPMENYRATPSTWQWENLELDPAFSSGTLRFLKGEEISVGAWHDVAPTTLYPQLHMLAYGFDPTDPFVEAFGGWGRKDLSEVMTEVVALGSSGGTVFTYAAHPSASSDILTDYSLGLLSAYAEPWLASDVTAALAFTGDDGELLFRGFEFWNGRQDDGRDASLGLWEEVLAEHPDNHHWYLAGGSDDHLSHYLAGTTALGDVRTVVAAQSNSQDDILDAYYNGRSIVTDGPWFTMGIDVNDDGDLMDFGVDGMLGEEFVVTAPELGVLEFDWPNQSGTPWGDSSGGTIALVQYGSNGTKRVHGVSGGQFDAYAEYETATGEFATGWQGYRAELDLNGYEAYTNPIWLYFDVNQQPTDIALSNNSVAENQPSGTVIGVLSGTDPDASQSATLTFSLVSGYGDNPQFRIDTATKQLKTAAVFDYETQNAYNIKVRATDSGDPAMSYDETFAITVTDVDDVAPTVTATQVNDGLTQRAKITSLAFQFSEDVSAGGVGALRLRNDTTGVDVDLSAAVLSGNGTAALTWDLSGVVLDDGRYTGTLTATDVTDAAGNPMAEDYIFAFHILKCDANGDAKVDGGDLAIWQQHYDPLGQNPNTPGTGDWNGDGKVDGGDLALWQQRYNPLGLPAPMKAGASLAVTEPQPAVAEAESASASEPTTTPLAAAEVTVASPGSESSAVGGVLGNEFLYLSDQGDAGTDTHPPTGWEGTLLEAEGTASSAAAMPESATLADNFSADETLDDAAVSLWGTGAKEPEIPAEALGLDDGLEDILALAELTVPLGG